MGNHGAAGGQNAGVLVVLIGTRKLLKHFMMPVHQQEEYWAGLLLIIYFMMQEIRKMSIFVLESVQQKCELCCWIWKSSYSEVGIIRISPPIISSYVQNGVLNGGVEFNIGIPTIIRGESVGYGIIWHISGLPITSYSLICLIYIECSLTATATREYRCVNEIDIFMNGRWSYWRHIGFVQWYLMEWMWKLCNISIILKLYGTLML